MLAATTTTEDGWTVMARTGSDDRLALGGHESTMIALCGALLDAGDTFLDVGAHVGAYALRMAEKAGHVVALEPAPDTLEALMMNVALNRERAANVTCLGVGAWSSRTALAVSEEARLARGITRKRITGDGSTHLTANLSKNYEVIVPVIPLDELLETQLHDERVGLIKVDVEGHEHHVLLGAEQLVARDRPKLCLEIHDELTGEDSWSLISQWLTSHQYVWSEPIPAGVGYHIIATPKEAADDSDGRDEGQAPLAG